MASDRKDPLPGYPPAEHEMSQMSAPPPQYGATSGPAQPSASQDPYYTQSQPSNHYPTQTPTDVYYGQQSTHTGTHDYAAQNHNPKPSQQGAGYYASPPPGQHQASQPQPQQQHDAYRNPAPSTYNNATPIGSLTSAPAPVDCPKCHQRTMTRVELKSGNTTNAWAAGLCVLTCLGCIPYCISSTKDAVHHCGNCGVQLATWHRSGRTEAHMFA